MQVIIHQWAFNGSFDQLASLPRQELVNDWFGYDVEPSAEFAFATDGEFLWFLASRSKAATIHPEARPGQFQPELWRYDLAEWFMAAGDGEWCAMARIPLNELRGVDIRDCKLAATFILDTPDQIFLTTADDLSGNPDFHRPDCFCTPILK